jgi:hypothetical protein
VLESFACNMSSGELAGCCYEQAWTVPLKQTLAQLWFIPPLQAASSSGPNYAQSHRDVITDLADWNRASKRPNRAMHLPHQVGHESTTSYAAISLLPLFRWDISSRSST